MQRFSRARNRRLALVHILEKEPKRTAEAG
jgi:hypothetical protein